MDKISQTINQMALWGADLTTLGTQLLRQLQTSRVPAVGHSSPYSAHGSSVFVSEGLPRRSRKNTLPLFTLLQSKPGRWLFALAGLALWGSANGQLLVSTGAGVVVMILVYRLQRWNWRPRWQEFRQFFQGSNRQLLMAVVSGAGATVLTYLTISIGLEAESPSIACALILQNLGIFGIFSVLAWQLWHHQTQPPENLQQIIEDLTHTHPLKRLMAVQEIHQWIIEHPYSCTEKTATQTRGKSNQITPFYLANCLRLMLSQEEETVIREAILESLNLLNPTVPEKSGKWETSPVKPWQPRPDFHSKPAKIPHFIDS